MKIENLSDALFTELDGLFLVSSTRGIIEQHLAVKKYSIPTQFFTDERFGVKLGCFVSLKENNAEKSLRGCIGFPEPVYELRKALPEAAISAATRDPRFPPVEVNEMENLLLEISILTKPVELDAPSKKDLPKMIEIGRDGLILKWSFGSGLLLPQVAPEFGWNAEDFLCNLSLKAGAPPDQWLVPGTQIFRFGAQVFLENSPQGTVSMS
ncbi:MAG: TIGR00296 family protein [Thaumarchaeota archaeon]|nr:TIGR00296 family protein [Nitrososphaerota archaeon]